MMEFITYLISGMFQSLASTFVLKQQCRSVTKKQLIIFYVCVVLQNVLSGFFVPNNIRFAYTLTSLIIIFYFMLGIKNRKSIGYSFSIIMLLTVSEVIITLSMVLCGIESNVIIQNIYYNMLANILISICAILLLLLPFIKKLIYKVNTFFNKNRHSIHYFFLIMLFLYLIIMKNGLGLVFISNYYTNILIVIAILIMFFLVVLGDNKNEQLKEINKQSMNYIRKYEKIITEQGKANHEFKNQLMVIRGYAQINSPKLMEYLDSIVDDTKKTKSTYLISQLNKFPDGGIKGLLYYKLSIMEEENIKYNIYCDESAKRKAKKLTPDQMKNITKIIGVLVDNAIDACKSKKNKEVNISLISERAKMIFNISNPIDNKTNITSIGTGYSTKGKGHGYGLQLVKDITDANNYIDYICKVEGYNYVTTLIIRTTKNL